MSHTSIESSFLCVKVFPMRGAIYIVKSTTHVSLAIDTHSINKSYSRCSPEKCSLVEESSAFEGLPGAVAF